ncbi:MAG: hypothetical protein ACK44W_00515 [Planctomycetota bacterium]
MTAVRFLGAILLAEAAGVALLSRLCRQPRSGPGALGLAFLLGTFVFGLWTHLLLWVRIPVTLLTVLVGPGVIAALGRWSVVRTWIWKRPPGAAWLQPAAAAFLLFGALSWPLLGFDGDTMYLPKAKSIVRHGTFWNEDFTDPSRIMPARRRPLLLPSLYADIALLSGSWEGYLLRVWFVLLQVGGTAAFYDVLRSKTGRSEAAWGAGVYAWLPALAHDSGGALSGYADAPLAFLFLFALASETRLAVFLLTAAVLLKDEGFAFLVPFALVRGIKPVLLPGLVGAAWIATASFLPLDTDFLPRRFLQPQLASLPTVLRHLGSELVALKHWSILWLIVLGVLACRLKTLAREDARWLLPVGVQLAIYAGVWLTFPPSDLSRLIKVEDMRLLLHVTPMAWTWAVRRACEVPSADSPGPPGNPLTPGPADP